jgi:signal transduction histidine kinase
MIERLQSSFEQIERFNSDVSHELKTPLTIVKGEAKFALKKPRDKKEYKESFHTILNQANSMQEMIDNLLLLVRYSKENIQKSFKKINVEYILLQVLEKYKNENIKIKKLESVELCSNAELIKLIFSNIIDNAVKYTPKEKNIYISLTQNSFIVEDEGIGIPQDKIEKITDRFYRVDESRNKSIKGFGLGLSIVKNSIDLLDWRLEIESEVGKGSKFKIIF